MKRRSFLAASCSLAIMPPAFGMLDAHATRTQWIVRGSQGLDALAFLAPLSGDPFYASYYEAAVAAFAPRLSAETMDAIRALKQHTDDAQLLLAPYFALRFSGGPHATIDELLHSLDNADGVLRPPFEASPYWGGEQDWQQFAETAPVLRSILAAMRESGFAEFHSAIFEPKANARFPALRQTLAGFDVVAEVERFTGRTLEPEVEIILLEFCKPHGIKVIGQAFLSAIDWPDSIVIRTAGHELLHPPVDSEGEAWAAALAVLQRDPLLARIVEEHDPAFGYNSLEGLIDEDLASALDQIIAERLGAARDAAERWTEVDGGMHVLAAGFYGLMQRSGFAETGGDLERWLGQMALYGWLAPPSLHGAAAQILGRPVDQLWPLSGSSTEEGRVGFLFQLRGEPPK